MQGSRYDYSLTEFELYRYEELKRQFVEDYNKDNAMHEAVFRELFNLTIDPVDQ